MCRPYLIKVVTGSHDLSVLSMSVTGLQKMGYFGGWVGVESHFQFFGIFFNFAKPLMASYKDSFFFLLFPCCRGEAEIIISRYGYWCYFLHLCGAGLFPPLFLSAFLRSVFRQSSHL